MTEWEEHAPVSALVAKFETPPSSPTKSDTVIYYDSAKKENSNLVEKEAGTGSTSEKSVTFVTDDIKVAILNDQNDNRVRLMEDNVMINMDGMNGPTVTSAYNPTDCNNPRNTLTPLSLKNPLLRNSLTKSLKLQKIPRNSLTILSLKPQKVPRKMKTQEIRDGVNSSKLSCDIVPRSRNTLRYCP